MSGANQPPRQLLLDLALGPSFEPDQFLVSSSNARAHGLVESWPDWVSPIVVLVGPAGAGKSHLGAMWASRSGARIVRPGAQLDAGHWSHPLVALVEDCDRAAYPEAGFFHLMNMARESGGWLVLTARTPPSRWSIATPDLLSRLRQAPIVTIDQPDAALIRAVIVKLFADRQIRTEEDVVAYAALHCDQSLEAISAFVAAVDDDALVANRRITRPLAAQTLARLRQEKPAP